MSKFIIKWRELLNVALYAALVSALVYFVAIPLYKDIETKRNEIQEQLVDQEMRGKKLQELPRIKQQYEFIKSKESDMDVLLKKDEAVTMIKKLEALAENTGNTISINVVEAPKGKTVSKGKEEPGLTDNLPSKDYLEINIKLIGTYANILTFISKIEAANYYSDITSLQINKVSSGLDAAGGGQMFSGQPSGAETGGNDDGKLAANLNVAFYLVK